MKQRRVGIHRDLLLMRPAALAIGLALLGARPLPTEVAPPPLPLDEKAKQDAPVIEARQKVEADPASAEARLALGNSYFDRGWAEAALEEYRVATALEPEYGVAWNNAGIVEEMLGKRSAALSSFQRAVAIDKYSAEAHFNLARTLEQNSSFDGAVKHYIAALRLKPELGDPVTNPRGKSSRLMLNAKLALYRAINGATLPPLGPAGESGLARQLTMPPLIQAGTKNAADQKDTDAGDGDEKPDAPRASPTPAPTPIVLGPGSIPSSSSASRPPGDSPARGTQAGRGIRRGGPMAPTPPTPRPAPTTDEQ